MTKKSRNAAKKANTFGSMGRIVFYSVALIVACCAVAVVLFETEAGQDLVAKVRGRKSPNSRGKPETSHSEKRPSKDSDESKTAERAETAESDLPHGESVLSREGKDTSANPRDNSDQISEARSDDVRASNEAREENVARETASETARENNEEFPSDVEPRIDEPTADEKEDWEIIDEKIDEDEQDTPVQEQDEPVEEQEKTAEDLAEEQEKPVEEQDKPVVELDKPVEKQNEPVVEQDKPVEEEDIPFEEPVFVENSEQDGNVDETEQNVPEAVKEKDEEKDVAQEVDGGEVEDEETITVGDSLVELEEQRFNEQLNAAEEHYDPIDEPEGPPIDQSPLYARRGLRGDYGGKDCKDTNKNCPGWAKLGECKKNAVWMEVNCKKSCNVCSCSDNDNRCRDWARTGECKKNAEWMNKNCMKSCEQC